MVSRLHFISLVIRQLQVKQEKEQFGKKELHIGVHMGRQLKQAI